MDIDHFFQSLIKSGWSGGISESGLGVPLQATLLSRSGASKVLQIGLCPYNKNFQGEFIKSGKIRSASREGVRYRAEEMLEQIEANAPKAGRLFSIATSCVHASPGTPGESHGWVYLIKSLPSFSDRLRQHVCMHFWVRKDESRTNAIDRSLEAMVWFLQSALLGQAWESPDYPLQNPLYIDVVDGHGVEFETQISLLTPSNPLMFDATGMLRPADAIRKYGKIYRGSFNPPTQAHEHVGRGAIYEICAGSVWGKKADRGDIKHRVEMLRLLGVPAVMISEDPYFAEFHNAIRSRELTKDPVTYVVGSDVMNAIVDPKNIRYDGFLDPLMNDPSHPQSRARFEVHLREGTSLSKSAILSKMDIEVVRDPEVHAITSTQARKGDRSVLAKPVAEYVARHNLYA